MAKFQCNACAGVFVHPQGGYEYYHVCPPMSVPDKVAAIKAGTVTVDAQAHADAAIALNVLNHDPVHDAPILAAHGRLERLAIDRPGFVDQNLVTTKFKDPAEGPPDIRSAGAGVIQIGA